MPNLREVREHELEELREVHLALAGYALDGLRGRVDELLRELRGVRDGLSDLCGKALDVNGHGFLVCSARTRGDAERRLSGFPRHAKTCGFMFVRAGALSSRHRRAVAGYS